MRILTIVVDLGPAGTQRVAQNYSRAYKRSGHPVAVLTHRGGGERQAGLEAASIPCFVGGPDHESLTRATRSAIDWNPDVIHLHRTGHPDAQTMSLVKAIRAGVGRRVPAIETNVFSRVDDSADRLEIDLHLHLTRWCFWKWKRWSTGLRPRPVGVVVPYMINAEDFYPITAERRAAFRAAHNIPADSIVLGRVGSPSLGKWSPVALDAFASAAAADPRLHLLTVGLPPELRPMLMEIAARPEIGRGRVTDIPFLSGDDALRDCYASMDIFLHAATIGETFGMVFCEAMLCGVPVIALSTPARDNSQHEVVGHEHGGLLVTDLRSMIAAIKRLSADVQLRQRLGAQARASILARFSEQPVSEFLLRVLSHVTASSSRDDLAARLRADADLITDVSDREIGALLRASMGTTPPRQRLLMMAVHNPLLYRFYGRVKAKLGR